jgi:uncharacterized protein (DUF58 family)
MFPDWLSDAAAVRAMQAPAPGWAEGLRLPFRQQTWRGQAGSFLGKGAGSSLDFHDQRSYLPGDDPRQINWQAYARTGAWTMKLYREEVRPLVDVVFDTSASMFAFPAKAQRSVELLAYTLAAAQRAGATVRIFAVRGREQQRWTEEAVRSGTWGAAVAAWAHPAASEPPALERVPFRPGSLRLMIGDLLFPGAPEPVVRALTAGNGRALLFVPQAREEADPGWEGNYEFLDPETAGTTPHRVEASQLRRYLAAYQRHFDLWQAAAAKHHAALIRLSAEADFQRALQTEGVRLGAVELG